jgi:hypothetical protein
VFASLLNHIDHAAYDMLLSPRSPGKSCHIHLTPLCCCCCTAYCHPPPPATLDLLLQAPFQPPRLQGTSIRSSQQGVKRIRKTRRPLRTATLQEMTLGAGVMPSHGITLRHLLRLATTASTTMMVSTEFMMWPSVLLQLYLTACMSAGGHWWLLLLG